jgi:hypothetical protein
VYISEESVGAENEAKQLGWKSAKEKVRCRNGYLAETLWMILKKMLSKKLRMSSLKNFKKRRNYMIDLFTKCSLNNISQIGGSFSIY